MRGEVQQMLTQMQRQPRALQKSPSPIRKIILKNHRGAGKFAPWQVEEIEKLKQAYQSFFGGARHLG